MGLKAALASTTAAAYARSNLPCFAYPARNEVEIGGEKMIGSAQQRAAGVFANWLRMDRDGPDILLSLSRYATLRWPSRIA